MAPQTRSQRKYILSTETKDVQYKATISTENRDEKLKVTQQNNGTRKRNRNKVIESRKQQHEAINSIENEKFEDAEQNKENRKRKLNKVVSRTKAKEKPLSNANMSGGKMCPNIILEGLPAEDLEKHGVMISKASQTPITTTHTRQKEVISNNQSEATISTENLDEISKETQPNNGSRKRKRSEVINTKNDLQHDNGTSNDLYAILGLPRSAQIQEIKASYFKLAKIHHPDRVEGEKSDANEKFNILHQAYSILSNPNTKSIYDCDNKCVHFDRRSFSTKWEHYVRTIDSNDIEIARKTYQGSLDEERDIIREFELGKGSMTHLYNVIPFMRYEDENRIIDIIKRCIDLGKTSKQKISKMRF